MKTDFLKQPPSTPPTLTSGKGKTLTMRKQAVGGLGALIQTPNTFTPITIVPPAKYISSPMISSLPYISPQHKDSEEILELKVHQANTQRQYAVWQYTDKQELALENAISGDISRLTKFSEPTSEQLITKYIREETAKRGAERLAIERQRMQGVDASMATLQDEIDYARGKLMGHHSEVAIQQAKRALTQLLQGDSTLSNSELNSRVLQLEGFINTHRNRIEATNPEVAQRQLDIQNILKLRPEVITRLNDMIEQTYPNMNLESLRQYVKGMNKAEFANKLAQAGGVGLTKQQSEDLVLYQQLLRDPKIRSFAMELSLPTINTQRTKSLNKLYNTTQVNPSPKPKTPSSPKKNPVLVQTSWKARMNEPI